MDELALTEIPEKKALANSAFTFLQQVSLLREELLKVGDKAKGGKGWVELAHEQIADVFFMTDKTDQDILTICDLYSDF